LIGRRVRLEALETERHADELHNITCGASFQESKSFDPNEVWGFLSYGPFRTCEELKRSPIFRRKVNEAGFAVIDNITNRLIGVVMLTNDDPENLTISLEPPIIKPSTEGNAEIIEAFFLLIEKLFAIGYRRVQLAIDSQDAVNKKMAARLGFTKESEIPKHMVVKDANRDSTIYGMLNSDWSKGCRKFLFKKLHGARIQKIDEAFNKKESELDEQKSRLAEQKALSETEISKP
jgi:RimJ/RimL family protein N-acetyltransferase